MTKSKFCIVEYYAQFSLNIHPLTTNHQYRKWIVSIGYFGYNNKVDDMGNISDNNNNMESINILSRCC